MPSMAVYFLPGLRSNPSLQSRPRIQLGRQVEAKVQIVLPSEYCTGYRQYIYVNYYLILTRIEGVQEQQLQ